MIRLSNATILASAGETLARPDKRAAEELQSDG